MVSGPGFTVRHSSLLTFRIVFVSLFMFNQLLLLGCIRLAIGVRLQLENNLWSVFN
jgi:hypothetical protein